MIGLNNQFPFKYPEFYHVVTGKNKMYISYFISDDP